MSARFRFDDTFFIDAVPIRKSLVFQEKQRELAGVVKSIIAVLLILGAGFMLLFQNTQPITNTGYEFLNALESNNYQSAYNLITPEMQTQYSQEEFQYLLSLSSTKQDLLYPNLHTVKPGGTIATIQGTIGTGRSITPVLLETEKIEHEWRISKFLFGADPFDTEQSVTPLFFPSF